MKKLWAIAILLMFGVSCGKSCEGADFCTGKQESHTETGGATAPYVQQADKFHLKKPFGDSYLYTLRIWFYNPTNKKVSVTIYCQRKLGDWEPPVRKLPPRELGPNSKNHIDVDFEGPSNVTGDDTPTTETMSVACRLESWKYVP